MSSYGSYARAGLVATFADVPSGDLKTDARGLTSEMKFIIALSGSFSCDLLPSAAGEASDPEGSLLVKANRAIFLVAFRGPCLPARARTVRAGERQRTVAGFMLDQTSSTCIERRSYRCRLFVWGASCLCPGAMEGYRKKVGSRVPDGQLVTIEVTSCVYLQWAVSMELFSHQESQILPFARKIFPIGLKRLPQPTTFIISSRMGKHPHPQIFREENHGLHHFPERPSSLVQTNARRLKRQTSERGFHGSADQEIPRLRSEPYVLPSTKVTSPVRVVPPHRTRGCPRRASLCVSSFSTRVRRGGPYVLAPRRIDGSDVPRVVPSSRLSLRSPSFLTGTPPVPWFSPPSPRAFPRDRPPTRECQALAADAIAAARTRARRRVLPHEHSHVRIIPARRVIRPREKFRDRRLEIFRAKVSVLAPPRAR